MSEDFCADDDRSNKESNAIYNEQRWFIFGSHFSHALPQGFFVAHLFHWAATKRGNVKLIL